MAGTTAAGELSAVLDSLDGGVPRRDRVHYALACRQDDPDLRRLLRENPMPGRISLTFEREPDFFAGTSEGELTIMAREEGRVVCVGRCTTRMHFIEGVPRHVAYLGELRLDAAARGRLSVVREGYQFCRHVQRETPAEAMFTSIAADNRPAIRLLERGLPGMPRYRFLTEYVTAVISVPTRPTRGEHVDCASTCRVEEIEALVAFLAWEGRRHELAFAWTRELLQRPSDLWLAAGDFTLVQAGGRIVAAGALWDQRRFRQTVIRGYDRALSLARPIHNTLARMFGGPRMPPVGSVLALAHVSPLTYAPGGEAAVVDVVRSLFPAARAGGVELLSAGFAAQDPALGCLRRAFRLREYVSRIYQVDWPDEPATLLIGSESLRPEVALL